MNRTNPESSEAHQVRLDKWLWAARFFKTRTLAKEAIDGGKVSYNGQRCKPGRLVEPGGRLTVRRGWEEQTVRVLKLSERRGPAKEAALLYEETEESLSKREGEREIRKVLNAAQLPPKRRPSKRDRRRIQQFKDQQGSEG